MQDRRKHPRISVDLPMTVRVSNHPLQIAKMIDLSKEGMRFLCPIAPEINSELELRFSLPSRDITREFRFMSNVRHVYEVLATSGTPPDYRYAVGVKFMNPQEGELVILDKFVRNDAQQY